MKTTCNNNSLNCSQNEKFFRKNKIVEEINETLFCVQYFFPESRLLLGYLVTLQMLIKYFKL